MLIECDVRYDAEQDRLVGGDFDRQDNGHWARSTLLPRSRIDLLWTRLGWLDRIFREDNGVPPDGPVPYPQPLTAIAPGGLPGAIDGHPQLVPLDLVFLGTGLRSAPPEFRDVIQLVCVIEYPTSLAQRCPTTSAEWTRFVTALFSVLGCLHRQLYLALTRRGGSSIGATSISPSGHLLDVYQLIGPGDLPGWELYGGQREDLRRGLALLPTSSDALLRNLLIDALTHYWNAGGSPEAEVTRLEATRLVDELGSQPPDELAGSALAGRW
jgi:hypothetical protein